MDFSPEAPAESHQPGPAKKAVTLDRGRGDQLYLARLQVAILSLSGKVGAVCRRRARFASCRSHTSPASLVSRPRRRSRRPRATSPDCDKEEQSEGYGANT